MVMKVKLSNHLIFLETSPKLRIYRRRTLRHLLIINCCV